MKQLEIPESSQKLIDDICRTAGISQKHALMIYRLGQCDGIIATLTVKKVEAVHV